MVRVSFRRHYGTVLGSRVASEKIVFVRCDGFTKLENPKRQDTESQPMKKPMLEGLRFSRLLVVREISSGNRGSLYLCKCDCGTEKGIDGSRLIRGHTKSCGCLNVERRKKHGCAIDGNNSRAYRAWVSMRERCRNKKCRSYPRYGGRGITVSESWSSFAAFLRDMGEPPQGGSLDRIDNNGPYSPENCRWASHKEQQNNKRSSRLVSINGATKTVAQWCDELGLLKNTAYERLRRGWGDQDAILTPAGEKPKGGR